MFASRGWARFSLGLNLLGSLCLLYSFQAASSDFRLVTTTDGRHALCADRAALVVTAPAPSYGVDIGVRDCPQWEDAKPAAVVSLEHPRFATFGFLLIIAGFALQFLAIPPDRI